MQSLLKQKLFNCRDEKEETQHPPKIDQPTPIATVTSSITPQLLAPTAQPEVDEDGYCIKPKDPLWDPQTEKKGELNAAHGKSIQLHFI